MAFVGAGVGMVMQNLVLVVQNSVHREDIGAGSSLIAFFRSLGGAIGVSVLGAVLATHARDTIAAGLRDLGIDPSKLGGGGASGVPDVDTLPVPVAHVVEHAFGTGIAEAFLFAVPLGLVALLALSLMHERPLGAKSGIQIAAERAAAGACARCAPPRGSSPTRRAELRGPSLGLAGGIGALDGGLVAALLAYGAHPASAAAAVLLYHAVVFWIPALVGTTAYLRLRGSIASPAPSPSSASRDAASTPAGTSPAR